MIAMEHTISKKEPDVKPYKKRSSFSYNYLPVVPYVAPRTKKLKIIKLKNSNKKESFYLNNSKIKKKININISIAQLKKECIRLSKILWT